VAGKAVTEQDSLAVQVEVVAETMKALVLERLIKVVLAAVVLVTTLAVAAEEQDQLVAMLPVVLVVMEVLV
jgi:hypothetical protein